MAPKPRKEGPLNTLKETAKRDPP